jgi:hypothetical protein
LVVSDKTEAWSFLHAMWYWNYQQAQWHTLPNIFSSYWNVSLFYIFIPHMSVHMHELNSEINCCDHDCTQIIICFAVPTMAIWHHWLKSHLTVEEAVESQNGFMWWVPLYVILYLKRISKTCLLLPPNIVSYYERNLF